MQEGPWAFLYIHLDTAEWLDQNNIYYLGGIGQGPVSLVYIPVAQRALVFTLRGNIQIKFTLSNSTPGRADSKERGIEKTLVQPYIGASKEIKHV